MTVHQRTRMETWNYTDKVPKVQTVQVVQNGVRTLIRLELFKRFELLEREFLATFATFVVNS